MQMLPILINFAVALFILWYFCKKPIGAFLFARNEKLSGSILEAKQLAEQSENELAEWERNFSESKSHAEKHLNEAKAMLDRFRQTIVKANQHEVERMKYEATMAAQSERARSKGILQRELIVRSVEMAKHTLATSLRDQDRAALVLDYSENLVHGAR